MPKDVDCEITETTDLTGDCELADDDDPLSLPPALNTGQDINSAAVLQEYKFKRRLILQVRKHRNLFDTMHKQFASNEAKQESWFKIAKVLKSDIDICRNTWADLRFEYQRYVRRLRKFFRSGNKNGKHRPIMALELEMLFLWRFVADKSYCAHPFVNTEEDEAESIVATPTAAASTAMDSTAVVSIDDDDDDDDIVILENDPVVVIDLDDENSYKKPPSYKADRSVYVVTKEARKLAELIKVYPELYDSKHQSFTDYKRKGIIWNAVANEMGDKATKLMKYWIHMQTRYEWELNQPSYQNRNADQAENESDLEKLLKFLQLHIMANPNTVFKQSLYLKKRWHEPIEHFKNIYNLLAIMKKFPQALSFTYNLITPENKEKYQAIWNDISKTRACPAGQCETTWIILRSFYWELMNMRKQSYQLQDKWYFESIITELYMHADVLMRPPPPTTTTIALPSTPLAKSQSAAEDAARSSAIPEQTLSTVPVNLDEDMISSTTITTKRAYSAIDADDYNSTNNIKMPRITSAKSLAPSPAAVANLNANKSLVKIAPLPTRVFNNRSGSTLNMVQLPYHLPEHTSVTAVAPHVEPSVSANPKLPTTPLPLPPSLPPPLVATVLPTSHQFSLPHVAKATASNSSSARSKKSIKSDAATSVVTAPPKTPLTTAAVTTANTTNYKMILPKITGALSLLNSNEIMIELIGSSSGNQLVVHGPPLSEKFSLSMPRTAHFIREVMAIPLLHNKNHKKPDRVNTYWQYLSQKFKIPVHICKACWNFLSENFAHFPQIAPMNELMKPFKSQIQVWEEDRELFKNFDSNATKMGWLDYVTQLPDLMEQIQLYPCLYKDNTKISQTAPLPKELKMDVVWRTIRRRFTNIKHIPEIWTAFKNVFEFYMSDLERGIDNKWPLNWWRILAKLMFLMENRYSSKEAFYYIVRNKIIEEIDSCNSIEMKVDKQYKSRDFLAKVTPTTVVTPLNCGPSTSLNALRLQTLPDIDAFALILAIRRHPDIYQKCESVRKLNAWSEVASEMQTSVSACRLTFQHALKNYRTHKACDPSERCDISQRYFKHFDAIYSAVKAKPKKLNIKTPWELNQSVDNQLESTETNYPEKFIVDINMTNSKPALVMKNWSYAIGTLRPDAQMGLKSSLRTLFGKYKSLAVALPDSH